MQASELEKNYQQVCQRIHQACQQFNRPIDSVQLLAVSKTKPISAIETISQIGQVAFGENYVQEMAEKQLAHPELEWHFIGPLQSNKSKIIATHANWMHSLDRIKIAKRLSEQRPQTLPPLQTLLQVNINNEATKSGFSFAELSQAVNDISQLPSLELRGLMAIPQATDDVSQQRANFAQLRQALEQLQVEFPELKLDQLSMGMSGDLEAAIAEGATIVRIGTDIFGARNYS